MKNKIKYRITGLLVRTLEKMDCSVTIEDIPLPPKGTIRVNRSGLVMMSLATYHDLKFGKSVERNGKAQ